ncbi:DNA-binding transcriptional regulator, AcrR family [Amycolatopsis xylanica]|uniref:DNA-binding transcriptional regulator, AcrR family n=1 Tax=Amycolatopsis xylanica TaxID=589385 RepID=A0A1H2TPD2_9PSEU|nr:TetR/AcrR family transcriptional regulator [Amycolatopsis xylanica]SDW45766.1 DNA-binding transcriptional regulator, AcrR family [Amycolatopsis xylanica]
MQITPETQPELGLSVTEQARRAQIISATIATIAELGYRKTSFAKIKERAGLSSTRIITYHFTNKAGLMQNVLTSAIAPKEQFLADRVADLKDRSELLRAYIDTEIEFLRSHPQFVRVLTELAANSGDEDGWFMTGPTIEQLRTGRIERQLVQGQREGAFGAFNPKVMAMSIAQAIDGVAAAAAADPAIDYDAYAKELGDLFVKATQA